MSELLEEAKENRDKALSEAKRSHGDGERGLYSGWQEAVDLIEKHEKSKELLQVKPSAFASSLTDVSRQKGYIKPKLTDEQQQLYKILKEAYADASEIYSIPIQETINYLMNEVFARDFNDKDIAVALRKFLSEVE